MSSTSPAFGLETIQAVISAKAIEDPAFGQELLANPKAAIEQLLDVSLPAHVNLVSVPQPAGTYVVAVPLPAVKADGELSDADLEAVAGGSKSCPLSVVQQGITKVASMAIHDAGGVANTSGASNAGDILKSANC